MNQFARAWQVLPSDRRRAPRVFALELEAFDRPGIYGEGGVDYPDNAARFAAFVTAALVLLPRLTPRIDVLHSHDWHTALAPAYLRTRFAGERFYDAIATVLTVHNAAYQGRFPPGAFADLGLPAAVLEGLGTDSQGNLAWLDIGLEFADLITTVSATHAAELCTPLGGFGLHERFASLGDRLAGLVNGIDLTRWDPRRDPALAAPFDGNDLAGRTECREDLLRHYCFPLDDPAPIVALVARLVRQKGIDLLLDGTVERCPGVRFLVLGRGLSEYEDRLRALADRFPDRVRVPTEFDDRLERQLVAGSDIVLAPSLFEPCGLTQMHAQRYGAIPVVRRVGGLAETVVDGETGFVFDEFSVDALTQSLHRALGAFADSVGWTAIIRRAMRQDVGWSRTATGYRAAYERIRHRPAHARQSV